MRITVSGPPGSGTTNLGTGLAERLKCKYVSAGDVFRAHAKARGMDLLEFSSLCESDPDVDKAIDDDQKRIAAENENIVLEGRLAGYMVDFADIRIYLYASPDCRARRIVDREDKSYETAKHETEVREESERKRYYEYYNIDIANLSVYDIIVNSEKWGKEEIADYVLSEIENFKKHKGLK